MRDEIVYEKIKNAVLLLDEIDDMINTQSYQCQQIDYEMQDWLHYIENNEVNDKQSIKIIKEMQRLRRERRCLHNEYEIEKTFKDNASKVMGNNTRPMLLAEIGKTVKQINSDYKNRVLTDEQINELLSEKKKRGRPRKETINEETE